MSNKKVGLLFILSFLSILTGGFLGRLDLYGFIDGKHALSLSILIGLLLVTYLSTIIIFILEFSDKRNLVKAYAFVSFFFGLTFFVINPNPIICLFSTLIYFSFLYYTYSASVKRHNLFISFRPQELFFPVLKRSFFYILLLLILLSFFQTKLRIAQNNVITPSLVVIITKPSVALLNKQISSQLQKELTGKIDPSLSSVERKKIIATVLKQSVDSMPKEQSQQYFGVQPHEIPIEKAIIYDNGDVDLSPVAADLAPSIADNLNEQLQAFSYILPFAVPLIVFLFLQPFMFILQIIENTITVILFSFLLRVGFLRIRKEMVEVERVSI